MKNKSKLVASLLIGTCLFTLVSCGSDNDDSSSSAVITEQQEEQQDDQGMYRAVLSSLNTSVSGNTNGSVEIKIEGDDFVTISKGSGAPAFQKHLHNITLGTSCPTEAADTNGDSFVDVAEAIAVTGPILVPIDSDLSAQLDGNTYGPIANSAGNYFHKRSTSLTSLLADLRAPDPDLLDPYVKLPAEQNLNLAGRVVIVHGVARNSNLPDTVATVGNFSREETLPIACGQLVRVANEGDPAPVETTTVETL